MGYKSFFRSLNAVSNAAAKERHKQRRKSERNQERIQKKITLIDEKMEQIENALNDLLAKGKIDKREYNQLLERKGDIDIDLVIFGKIPGVNLAKRYICGKIDKEQFESIKREILPSDLVKEKEFIVAEYNKRCDAIAAFEKNCEKNKVDICQKCNKKAGLFSWIKEIEGLNICGKCRKELIKLQKYPGYNGHYFSTKTGVISIQDIKNEVKLTVGINSKFL